MDRPPLVTPSSIGVGERRLSGNFQRAHERPVLFRFVGCLLSTTDMSAGHKRMRAGVVQIPMEETAECSGVAGTFSAMGIEEVGCGVGLTQRWGKAG